MSTDSVWKLDAALGRRWFCMRGEAWKLIVYYDAAWEIRENHDTKARGTETEIGLAKRRALLVHRALTEPLMPR